jgi:hypothetical protein
VLPRRRKGALRTGSSFGGDLFVTFRAGNKGHGVNFRSGYFTDFSSIFFPDLSGRQSRYLEISLDLCVNAGVSSSFLNRMEDEGEGLAFTYSLSSDLLFSRESGFFNNWVP